MKTLNITSRLSSSLLASLALVLVLVALSSDFRSNSALATRYGFSLSLGSFMPGLNVYREEGGNNSGGGSGSGSKNNNRNSNGNGKGSSSSGNNSGNGGGKGSSSSGSNSGNGGGKGSSSSGSNSGSSGGKGSSSSGSSPTIVQIGMVSGQNAAKELTNGLKNIKN